MIKKILSSFLLFAMFLTPCFSKDNVQKKVIEMYDSETKAFLGSLTIKQFNAMIKASVQYSKEMSAEDNGRIKVLVKENPWLIKDNKKFKTEIDIIWVDEKDNVLKKITITVDLQTLKDAAQDNKGRFMKVYEPIAIFGFPITLLLTILAILL